MTILAFIQCPWHPDHQKVRDAISDAPRAERAAARRAANTARILAGPGGVRLRALLGLELCTKIKWECTSTEIAAFDRPPMAADLAHIAECYEEFQPQIVVGFGRTAGEALVALREEYQIPAAVTFLSAPHPAARHQGVEAEIKLIAHQISDMEFRASAPVEVDFG